MKRARRKGGSKDKVFGCDLMEHLTATNQEIPQVLRSCSEFIEKHGIVDGIYRLSGVSSNIQKLRSEFDSDGTADLYKELYLQDIHCVSSLCKAYFRELPNPLLTYQLYDHFAEAVAVQLEPERLVKIKDVLKDLPRPHYRTLEYLMKHLVRVATFSSQTNMHARNLAIVWAPNLLRSKDIEATGFNGTAAFMEVRVQSIVVEFILTHVSQLFPETAGESGLTFERRKSLPSPSALTPQEEQFFKTIPFQYPGNMSPGDGPPPMRPYHAIIDGTDKRKGSLKGRKWKSIFNLGGRLQDPRKKSKYTPKEKDKTPLRPAKSMDSLSSGPYAQEDPRHHSPQLSSPPAASTNPEGGGQAGSGNLSSGYAVTYRRTGGASVSMVSGGGGTQGTYKNLEAGGTAGSDRSPVPSHGVASRAERRAGMHISGPFSVTVPLHITSGLALGVLHGGRAEEETALQGATEEDPTQKEKQGDDNDVGKEQGAEGRREESSDVDSSEVKDNIVEDEVKNEKGAREEEEKKESEVDNEEERTQEKAKCQDDNPKNECSPHTSNRPSVTEYAGEEDYMDMRSGMLKGEDMCHRQWRLSQEENLDNELPLDFQDTFGFLDLMDNSATSQINEFSVEPPGYEEEGEEEEEEEEEEEKDRLCLTHPAPLQSQPDLDKPLLNRNLLSSPHRTVHGKSHSLPYKSQLFLPILSSSSDEDEVYSGPDDDNEDSIDSDKGEYEDMFCQSLPCGQHFQGLKWTSPQTVTLNSTDHGMESDQPESLNQTHIPEGSQDLPSPIPGEILTQTDIVTTDDNGLDPHVIGKGGLSPLPLEMEYLSMEEKTQEDINIEGLAQHTEIEEVEHEDEAMQGRSEECEAANKIRESHICSKEEDTYFGPEPNNLNSGSEEDTYFGPESISAPLEPCNTETFYASDQLLIQDETGGSIDDELSSDLEITARDTTVTAETAAMLLEDESSLTATQDESETEELSTRHTLTGNKVEEEQMDSREGGEEHSEVDESEEVEEIEEPILVEAEDAVEVESGPIHGGKSEEGKIEESGEGVEDEQKETRRMSKQEQEGVEEATKRELAENEIKHEGNETCSEKNEEDEREHAENRKEGSEAGEEGYQGVQEDDVVEKNETKTDSHLGEDLEIEVGSIPEEREKNEEEDMLSEEGSHDGEDSVDSAVVVHTDQWSSERDKEKINPETPSLDKEKPLRPPRMKEREVAGAMGLGAGVGKTVLISRQAPARVYQVKSVPVVPPKPQHAKITAFKQQFQQRDTERQQKFTQYTETERQHTEKFPEKNNGKSNHDQGKGTDEERAEKDKAGDIKKWMDDMSAEGTCHSLGIDLSKGEGDRGAQRDRRGTWDSGSPRKDGQKELEKEAKRASGISMCFDEAVARATGKRCKEKESLEKERFIDLQ